MILLCGLKNMFLVFIGILKMMIEYKEIIIWFRFNDYWSYKELKDCLYKVI